MMRSRRDDEHLPQLDALRTFAVFAVMLAHYAPKATEALPLGELGVRLFFVLSGFLITGILLRCRRMIVDGAAPGAVLRRFYARRFLRLIPAYYALLAAMWIAGIPTVRDSLPWHAAYASNVYFARLGTWHGETSHFWSLAVEEQFYLVWPLLILFQPARRAIVVVLAVALTAPAFRLAGMWRGWSDVGMTVLPFASLDSLALGALLALLSTKHGNASARLSAVTGWLAILALVSTGLLVAHVEMGRQVRDVSIATLWSCSFVWLVQRSAVGFRGLVGAVLEHPLLVYLGRISYGLYLFHTIGPRVMATLWALSGIRTSYPPNALVGVAGPMLITMGVAGLSWHWYESPINALKRYLPYDPRADASAGVQGIRQPASSL